MRFLIQNEKESGYKCFPNAFHDGIRKNAQWTVALVTKAGQREDTAISVDIKNLYILPVHGSRENTRETIVKKLNHSEASGS